MSQVPRKNIVVIGAGESIFSLKISGSQCSVAGVIGLSTAIKLQEKGSYAVSIIAETLPTDPKCIKYTSHWAVSFNHLSNT